MYLPYNGYIESCSKLRNSYSLGFKKTEIHLPASFVLKTLEKSDVLFPFTVAALTWNLYGQYSSKPVTDSIFVSNPELYKCIDFNFNITIYLFFLKFTAHMIIIIIISFNSSFNKHRKKSFHYYTMFIKSFHLN